MPRIRIISLADGDPALYVIYKNPLDYPGNFVVRKWHCAHAPVPDLSPIIVTASLTEARAAIPSHCSNLGREPEDDPVILECWL